MKGEGASNSVLYLAVLLFIVNWLPPITTEVVIQDVRWTRQYNDLDENYYGTCRFVQTPCGHVETQYDGVCVQRGRCNKTGGNNVMDCQGGMGECCHFEKRCTEEFRQVEVDQLVTNLVNPLAGVQDSSCTFRFRKDIDICQIRLDFVTFLTESANEDGNCGSDDRLRIGNSVTLSKEFITCGNLAGQHMYLSFGSDDDVIEVTPQLKSINNHYHILATKIPCNSRNRAPAHCLQYFNKMTGRVTSFDFGGQQQTNQQYSVCVQPLAQSSEIQWKPCTNVSNAFSIISNLQGTPATCNTDWIQIKGKDKVCEHFGHQSSSWKAYELLVNFDEKELGAPPLGFTKPVDPANCAASCISMPGLYDCSCLDDVPNQTCHCIAEYAESASDFNNTGFCLEYTQI